jgi:hypothetical protein
MNLSVWLFLLWQHCGNAVTILYLMSQSILNFFINILLNIDKQRPLCYY